MAHVKIFAESAELLAWGYTLRILGSILKETMIALNKSKNEALIDCLQISVKIGKWLDKNQIIINMISIRIFHFGKHGIH